MNVPFERVVRRKAMRRFLVPLSLVLAFVAIFLVAASA
jgi:hypothetical protein